MSEQAEPQDQPGRPIKVSAGDMGVLGAKLDALPLTELERVILMAVLAAAAGEAVEVTGFSAAGGPPKAPADLLSSELLRAVKSGGFAETLMTEEGIFYSFTHSRSGHGMVVNPDRA
jgi:hypothetical protein